MMGHLFNNQYRVKPYTAPSTIEIQTPPKPAASINKAAKDSQPDIAAQLKSPRYDKRFLEEAKEALVYQRLGVDKEKIDELKAAIEDLAKKMQSNDDKDLSEQMDALQNMLEQEFQKGRERMGSLPEHEKGKIISALV
jgi:anti-sigma28 factor (negative regulator of flagellin synthesis)